MKTLLLLFILSNICLFPAKAESANDDTLRSNQLQQVRQTAFEQSTQGARLKARKGVWLFGGSLGMAFGNKQTTLSLAPQVGYSQSPYFSIGGGITYNYYHASKPDDKMNYLGLNIFGEINPFPYLAFRLQPELYEGWGKTNGKNRSAELIPTILIGGGIRLPFIKGTVGVMFYYDVLQYDDTPYGDNLFYTIGYTFTF